MRPSDVKAALKDLIPTGQSVWIHGPPGVGKSAIVEQTCAETGTDLWAFPPTVTLDPVDVRGLPVVVDGETRWARPDLWPADMDWQGVIFLDELPQGSTAVMASLMQAVHAGRIGRLEIPPGATFVACGNRQEDRAGVNRVITPLLNRFIHLDMEVSNDDWQAWALAEGIDPSVRAFLAYRPALLHDFQPAQNPRAFPSPRSWEFCSNVVNRVRPDLLHMVVAGAVGEGPAAEYAGFRQIYTQLPDPDALLASPQACKLPDPHGGAGPALYYALCGALVERLRKGDPKLLNNYATLAARFPEEFATLAYRDGCALAPTLPRTPAGRDWVGKHRHLLLGDPQ